jgi:hypothetical protein
MLPGQAEKARSAAVGALEESASAQNDELRGLRTQLAALEASEREAAATERVRSNTGRERAEQLTSEWGASEQPRASEWEGERRVGERKTAAACC